MNRTRLREAVTALLVAGAAACGPSGAPGREDPPTSSQAPGAASPGLSESARALLAILPADGAVPGWTRKAEPRAYDADSLWDFINGGAEAYLACGFQEVMTSEYVNPGFPSGILVDVYRMSDAGGAMGIYLQERGPTYDPRPFGADGHSSGTTLHFWSNAYYVKLTAFEERDDIKAAMAQIAEVVSRSVGPPGPRPASSGRPRCGADVTAK